MSWSMLARILGELNELTGIPSRRFNVLPHTLRNTDILYGLYIILAINKIPEFNEEFVEPLEKLRRIAGE